jgi:hypothetical protein
MSATNVQARLDRLEEGEWLNRLLADMRSEVVSYPSPESVARMRTRLLREMTTPVKAAA